MKIDSRHLAIAVAISLAIMWVICSLFVALIPEAVMSLTGVMIHAELSAFTWSLTWANFFIGLVAWPSIGGVTAWLISSAYNRLSN